MPVLQSSGLIGSSSGRPDGYFADAIYSSEVVDLRLSAYKDFSVNNTMQHLISGSARGASGDWEIVKYIPSGTSTNASSSGYCYFGTTLPDWFGFTPVLNGGYVDALERKMSLKVNGEPYYSTGAALILGNGHYGVQFKKVSDGSLFPSEASYTDLVYGTEKLSKALNSGGMLHCDVLGSPANYPQQWKDALANGYTLMGSPLLVGEEGEDYTNIGDGGTKVYKLSKKASSFKGAVNLPLGGSEYLYDPTGLLNTTTNTIQYGGQYEYSLVFYTTYPETVEPVSNTAVKDGEIGDVLALSSYVDVRGVSVGSSLINKVLVSTAIPHSASKVAGLTFPLIEPDTSKISVSTNYQPSHDTINLGASNPAVKALPYKTEDGVKVVFKEMKWDYSADTLDELRTNTDPSVSTTYSVGNYYSWSGGFEGGRVYRCTASVTAVLSGFYADDGTGTIVRTANGLAYFEIWDGNGWGDDENNFNIVDNVSTTIDTNGQTILVGQKRIKLKSDLR